MPSGVTARVGIENASQVNAAQDGLSRESLLNTYPKGQHARNAQGECLAPEKHDDEIWGN